MLSRPLLLDTGVKDLNLLAGFTSGEGCFFIYRFKSYTCKIGKGVILKFKIAQHRETELIKILISSIRWGRIELNLAKSAVYFVVTKYQYIVDKVILFFFTNILLKVWKYQIIMILKKWLF